MTGRRPTSSGIRPNLTRSSGSACSISSLAELCDLLRTVAEKPMPLFSERLAITFDRPSKAPPQMNMMLVVSICTKSWFGCLRPPCGGTEAIVPSMSFQQGLLHALPRHVARDGRIVGLARNLVDFIDIDDAALGFLDVIVAALQQLLNDVFHVFTHVTGFGQVVASAITNGTLSMRARVCASRVLPEPVGPTSKMLLLASSMSSFLPRCLRRL